MAGKKSTGKQRVRPTQERIEVSPDPPSPKLPGALRGLNPDKYIIDNSVKHTVESADDEDNDTKSPPSTKHTTRASRGLGKDVSYASVIPVTRPNSAATRRQSKSASLAISEAEDEDDSATIDSDEDLSEETSHDEPSENSQDEVKPRSTPQPLVVEPRLPDPKASRHSVREAAKKAVNYSKKYHPQDHGIPGYRHRPFLTQADQTDSVASTNLKKRSASIANEGDAIEEPGNEQAEVTKGKPRKKLKSLGDEPPSRTKKKRGGQRAPTKIKTKAKPANKAAFRAKEAEEIDDLVNMAIAATQKNEPVTISSNDDSDGERTPASAADDYDDLMPNLPGMLSREDSRDTANMPDKLLTACTQVSNLPDTDESGMAAHDEPADSRDSSLLTVDTSATLAHEVPTPATTFHATPGLDTVPFPLPTYVEDQMRLKVGSQSSITFAAVVRTLFEQPRSATDAASVVQKPYLEHPVNRAPEAREEPSRSPSPQDTTGSTGDEEHIGAEGQIEVDFELTGLELQPTVERPNLDLPLDRMPSQRETLPKPPIPLDRASSASSGKHASEEFRHDESRHNELSHDEHQDDELQRDELQRDELHQDELQDDEVEYDEENEDPYEMHTPVATEFEDAMAVTESSAGRSSDPINFIEMFGVTQKDATTQQSATPNPSTPRTSQLISRREALGYDDSEMC
ncbi:hypothetical protein CKM354_000464000 [Cercospora kikuchii]|uniref:Uncharacterized protein n=1 Tax=Cercospora kikuchii TaxID=84275 RepID=A0A9P3CEJ5_9PEZI|nr:uncharacterized protein CKM354_000464000 [Cercospora kikuchii]GIZ41333.1 hypothetical protein CKM354_000464000 [Cercospora kikuchii]